MYVSVHSGPDTGHRAALWAPISTLADDPGRGGLAEEDILGACPSPVYSAIAILGAGGDNFMTSPDNAPPGASHGQHHHPAPPLRRNHSSLRLLTELTRERIALRYACPSCPVVYSSTADWALAIYMPGQNCTSLSSSIAMHFRTRAAYRRRRPVSTAVLLPLPSSLRCALVSVGPL